MMFIYLYIIHIHIVFKSMYNSFFVVFDSL